MNKSDRVAQSVAAVNQVRDATQGNKMRDTNYKALANKPGGKKQKILAVGYFILAGIFAFLIAAFFFLSALGGINPPESRTTESDTVYVWIFIFFIGLIISVAAATDKMWRK